MTPQQFIRATKAKKIKFLTELADLLAYDKVDAEEHVVGFTAQPYKVGEKTDNYAALAYRVRAMVRYIKTGSVVIKLGSAADLEPIGYDKDLDAWQLLCPITEGADWVAEAESLTEDKTLKALLDSVRREFERHIETLYGESQDDEDQEGTEDNVIESLPYSTNQKRLVANLKRQRKSREVMTAELAKTGLSKAEARVTAYVLSGLIDAEKKNEGESHEINN
ncbi:hypothetical protein ACXO7D_05375 [Lactobacillus delbrueckii subsp. bulgaricus]|nr:hypothetical protein [Lactobacillus delbrueckii subsp. bulgaricus]MBT9001243.1 hypothetical protein [Lactobacillus delbrueckii subsp. bulgaricus]